ncbi:MAG: hypothetical protein K2N94_09875, partial [Lachnospiraceae bacterium]|nr:hypothetical protein [Lachnospiraceae bacterium]
MKGDSFSAVEETNSRHFLRYFGRIFRVGIREDDGLELTDSVKEIKGIGEKTAQTLTKLGIFTVGDLIAHYPRSYEVYELPVPIRELREGQLAAVEAGVAALAEVKRLKGLQIVTCSVQDATGTLRLTWFNQVYLKNVLKRGT